MSKPSKLALCAHLRALARLSACPWLMARFVHGCYTRLSCAPLTLLLAAPHSDTVHTLVRAHFSSWHDMSKVPEL